MEFSPPVFAAQFGVPFLWLAIVLLDGYRGMGVGVLPSAMVWPRWVEAAGFSRGRRS